MGYLLGFFFLNFFKTDTPCFRCMGFFSASLREGGGERSEPEGACATNTLRSQQTECFFVRAFSFHRYRGPPPSRREACDSSPCWFYCRL